MNVNIRTRETWTRLTVERAAHKQTQETDKCGDFPKCPPLTCDTQPLAWNPTF